MPPSARARTDVSVNVMSAAQKATILGGEDFPLLRATLNAVNRATHKQKKLELL